MSTSLTPESCEMKTELQNYNGLCLILYIVGVLPLMFPQVSTVEMWWVFVGVFVNVFIQYFGSRHFYRQYLKTQQMPNSFAYILWRGMIVTIAIVLSQCTGYAQINQDVNASTLWLMMSPIPIVYCYFLIKYLMGKDFSYQQAVKIGRIKPGVWAVNFGVKYQGVIGEWNASAATKNRVEKIGFILISCSGAIGGAFAGSDFGAYFIYLIEVVAGACITWMVVWGCWLDIIYVFRAGLSTSESQ